LAFSVSCRPTRGAATLVGHRDDREGAEIVLAPVAATCDPRETLPVGALIDSAPAVSVKVAVAAAAGTAVAAVSTPAVVARTKNFRILSGTLPLWQSETGMVPSHLIGIRPT
jgi:hypothetical protein